MPMPSAVGGPSAAGNPGEREDPLAAVLDLGLRASRDGLVIGLLIALMGHSMAIASPFTSLLAMRNHVSVMREDLHSFFWAEYDVDMVQDEAEEDAQEDEPIVEEAIEEPEEPEELEPAPLEEAVDEPEDDPYDDDEPPPAPAEASDTLTAEATDDPVELDGTWSVPDKDGSTSNLGGRTAGDGTAKKVVRSKHASTKGKPGGKGKGTAKPRKKRRRKKSKARAASLSGSRSWNCPFPPQADLEQVDRAIATVSVTVGTSGRATSARIISDPGYGFGQMARRCALSRRYRPAMDADGNKISSTTPPLRVHFRR